MPKNTKSINNNLFQMLKSHGYEPVPLDSSGKKIPVPDEADVFQFTVKAGNHERFAGKKHVKKYDEATVTVSIDDNHDLKIYYGSDASKDDNWYNLLKFLKRFAARNQMGFDPVDEDQLTYDMAKRQHMNKDRLKEGKWTVNAKTGAKLDPKTGEELPTPEKSPKSTLTVSLKDLDKNRREKPHQSPFKTQDEKVARHLKAAQKFGREQAGKTARHHFAHGMAKDDLSKFEEGRNQGVAKGLNEMDSEGYKGTRDESSKGKEHKAKAIPVKKMQSDALGVLNKAVKKQPKKKSVAEGYYAAGKRASYNDAIPEVKILVQHSRPIEEGEQRFRNVERIFIENTQGERIRVPTNNTAMARTFARLIAEGDKPYGDRWTHLQSLCEDYTALRSFVRAAGGHQLNEGATRLIEACAARLAQLRESLQSLSKHRGYHAYFENWTPTLLEDDASGDTSAVEHILGESMLQDPRVSGALPVLGRINATIAENASITEVDTLESWADSIISETESDEEAIAESVSDEAHRVMQQICAGELELYDVMNHPKDDAQRECSKELHDLYQRVAGEQGLHADDDFEEIESHMLDYLEDEYGPGEEYLDTSHDDGLRGDDDDADMDDEAMDAELDMDDEVKENLDADQKRAGQWGPTGGPAKVGDLVGENSDPELSNLRRLSGLK